MKKTSKISSKKSLFVKHKLKFVILFIIFLLIILFWPVFNLSFQDQNTSSTVKAGRFAPDKDIQINSTISYVIPESWENISDNGFSVFLRNGELKTGANNVRWLDGADIAMYVYKNNEKKTASEILTDIAANRFMNKPNITEFSANNLEGAYQKIGFEGVPSDMYILANDDYYWSVTFSCLPDCSANLLRDRDSFINSLKAD